jgi:hypothetical protein
VEPEPDIVRLIGEEPLRIWPAALAIIFVQSGAIAAAAQHAFIANGMAALSAATLAWRYGEPIRPRRQRKWQFAVSALLSVFGALFLIREMPVHISFGSTPPQTRGGPAYGTADRQARSTGNPAGDAWPGVILWPDRDPVTRIIAPLPALGPGLFKKKKERPLTIPFYGAYWFYRWPDRRPPAFSYTVHGRADAMSFHSNDGRALVMQAHQNLGVFIDLTCCSRIELTISNADRYVGSVSIEVLLTNTALAGRPVQSLGSQPVTSTSLDLAPLKEILAYPFPAAPVIPRFDEITVAYHLSPLRQTRSARIALEQFTFVPRS